MDYRIDRQALHHFVDQQVTLIESTPLPGDIRAIVPAVELDDRDLGCVWLSAGLATQVGLVLLDEPQRFVELAPGVEDLDLALRSDTISKG
jgi:hypothetical protein